MKNSYYTRFERQEKTIEIVDNDIAISNESLKNAVMIKILLEKTVFKEAFKILMPINDLGYRRKI